MLNRLQPMPLTVICWHASHITAHPSRPWTMGRAYARVLPDPVGALMQTSCILLWPPAVICQAAVWTGYSSTKPSASGWSRSRTMSDLRACLCAMLEHSAMKSTAPRSWH